MSLQFREVSVLRPVYARYQSLSDPDLQLFVAGVIQSYNLYPEEITAETVPEAPRAMFPGGFCEARFSAPFRSEPHLGGKD
jgi:hypothetical protein